MPLGPNVCFLFFILSHCFSQSFYFICVMSISSNETKYLFSCIFFNAPVIFVCFWLKGCPSVKLYCFTLFLSTTKKYFYDYICSIQYSSYLLLWINCPYKADYLSNHTTGDGSVPAPLILAMEVSVGVSCFYGLYFFYPHNCERGF